MAINPTYSLAERLSMWWYCDPSYQALLLIGLRKAGLPLGPDGS
jgi:hypothetical protein